MFFYTADFSSLCHSIIDKYILDKSLAIDATLGNGFDTDFLSSRFKKVIAFDIQKTACDFYNTKKNENVLVINDSHHKFENYINEEVNCIIYNLGFLPGGDKNITTLYETSLASIKSGLNLLKNEGLMLIVVYRGHEQGEKEESIILEYLLSLNKHKFSVMKHEIINRSSKSPMLFVIEKK